MPCSRRGPGDWFLAPRSRYRWREKWARVDCCLHPNLLPLLAVRVCRQPECVANVADAGSSIWKPREADRKPSMLPMFDLEAQRGMLSHPCYQRHNRQRILQRARSFFRVHTHAQAHTAGGRPHVLATISWRLVPRFLQPVSIERVE